MHFTELKTAVAEQWARMSPHPMFRAGVDKDAMWAMYLDSFPEGTNPIFRTRTEHDCSCCRQFIRAVGDVVAVIDGETVSLWDFDINNPAYRMVARNLGALVRSEGIADIFFHTEGTAGTDKNHEQMDDHMVHTWEHFFVRLPNSRVKTKDQIGPALGEARAAHDVLLRGLIDMPAEGERTASKAITLAAIDSVLDLIRANQLYRGEQHGRTIEAFRDATVRFHLTPEPMRDAFVWARSVEMHPAAATIRNSSIGTLLVELSEGMDLERAVGRYERMVAPENYRRPTALVTPAMVARAKATVEELGLTSALERRYAHLRDITIPNVLYADRSARKAMEGGAFDGIATPAAVKPPPMDKLQEVPVETFLTQILPNTFSLEVLMEGRHTGNLVSLLAPVDPNAGRLFQWDNGYSWSYAGDFADAVKERVKKAGGNVTGDLCCRLAWSNTDDLDFHLQEPRGEEIYFGNKMSRHGGQLDVDMNVSTVVRDPVENIFYGTADRMLEGRYRLSVHSYTKRETIDVGFEAEIDFKGTVYRFAYPKPLRPREAVTVAVFNYTRARGLEIIESLPPTMAGRASRKVWNIDTETFQRVNVVMLSPNHWDGQGVGNRHYFFMLAGCENDGTARGFYNEFLRGDLDQHRKVLELVGAKMRTEESANQLSGLGFASTARNHAIIRVNGTRMVRVTF